MRFHAFTILVCVVLNGCAGEQVDKARWAGSEGFYAVGRTVTRDLPAPRKCSVFDSSPISVRDGVVEYRHNGDVQFEAPLRANGSFKQRHNSGAVFEGNLRDEQIQAEIGYTLNATACTYALAARLMKTKLEIPNRFDGAYVGTTKIVSDGTSSGGIGAQAARCGRSDATKTFLIKNGVVGFLFNRVVYIATPITLDGNMEWESETWKLTGNVTPSRLMIHLQAGTCEFEYVAEKSSGT